MASLVLLRRSKGLSAILSTGVCRSSFAAYHSSSTNQNTTADNNNQGRNPFQSGAAQVISPPDYLDHGKLLKSTLVCRHFVSGHPTQPLPPTFKPSPASSMCTTMAFGYSLFYKDACISTDVMKKSISKLARELPAVAGRLKPPPAGSPPPGLKTLGGTEIALNDLGVEFVVASTSHTIQQLGPHTWTSGMSDKTLTSFGVPFYTEPVNVDAKIKGEEALLKIKLTHCADGSIVSLMVSHVLADAGRAVKLAERLSQLYKSETTGQRPPPSLQFNPHLETPQGFADALQGDIRADKVDFKPDHTLSASQWLAAPYRMYKHVTDTYDMHLIHLPAAVTRRLKSLAASNITNGDNNNNKPTVSTMDAVQAFLVTLKCSLRGWPLVPTAPSELTVNVDLLHKDMPFKDPSMIKDHIGNAVHILHVPGVSKGTDIPACDVARDSDGAITDALVQALKLNAGLIRKEITAFRSDTDNAIRALKKQELLVSIPEGLMAAAFVVKGAELKSASTTAVSAFPFDNIDFCTGPPVFTQINYQPRFDWWSIIQDWQQHNSSDTDKTSSKTDGVLCNVVIRHGLQNELVTHPIWRLLAPEARIVVADGRLEAWRKYHAQHAEKDEKSKALQHEGYYYQEASIISDHTAGKNVRKASSLPDKIAGIDIKAAAPAADFDF